MPHLYAERAALYDPIYHWKDYGAEAVVLRDLLRSRGVGDGARVLEVACGTGNYLAALAAWYVMEGCDQSPEMLAIAQPKVPTAPLWTSDMRTLDLDRRYDAVLCLFSSIGYLLDDGDVRDAISGMASGLRPGGVLIVEPWLERADFDAGRPSLQVYDGPELKLARATVSRMVGECTEMDMHWLVARRDQPVEHFVDSHTMWFCPKPTMAAAFAAAGLDAAFMAGGLGTGRGLWVGWDRPAITES